MQTSFRVAALYFAQPHMDYLESSVRSVHSSVERIVVGVSKSMRVDRNALDRAQSLAELSKQVEVVCGDWSTTQQCMNGLARKLAEQGVSHVLIMDPQDVYDERDLCRILSFVEKHRNAGHFQIRTNAYWKSPLYRIEPLDSVARTVISRIDLTAGEFPIVSIPEDVGTCHSFTYASATGHIIERLRDQGITSQALEHWKKQVWDVWKQKRQLRNLHPELPERFRAARRIHACELPQALANHVHLEYEIVAEESTKKPACSLVFLATTSGSSLTTFVDNVAATVPDDCEIVACASTDEAISLLESRPGIRVVRISEQTDLYSAWMAGSKSATTEGLVFLTSRFLLAGDWIEGFIAALGEARPRTVYAPRIEKAIQTVDAPRDFEKRRGRHYSGRSIAGGPFDLNSETCWACSKKTLTALKEDTASQAALQYIYLDDTLLFRVPGESDEDVQPTSNPESVESDPLRASIVIPIYNNLHLTKACLESILKNTEPGTFELIIVDNGSTDGSREYLESIHTRVRLIHNRRNLFFAKGCNRGAWAARGENIVFLNNDTLVKPGWLDELLRPVEADQTIGIVGNKQVFPDSHAACANRVWHAGMVIGADKLPWHVYYGFDPEHPLVNRERDCVSVSGCCLLIRRRLFEQLAGFDPHFQNGFEDVDLCLRAGELGYRIVYAPRSEIVHYVSSSESRFDREKENLEKFKARWAERLVSNEIEFYREAGLLPSASGDRTKRVGFVSAFNQECSTSHYAEGLLEQYPAGSYVVLSEFGIWDRGARQDSASILRCWDRGGTWYYPLLRWVTALELDPIHINFDHSLFPSEFLEVLTALKNARKRVVVTFHETSRDAPLLASVAQLADAVIVDTPLNRLELILADCDAAKIHVISPGVAKSNEQSQRNVRERLGIPLTQRLIASNGSVTPETGILETITAISELRKGLDVGYLVLGSAQPHVPESRNYLERCKAAARRLSLEQHVFFLESLKQDELMDYIAAADAIVLFHQTGRCGWSNDAALALSAGRPVIASTDPMFMAFGDALLPRGDGSDLIRALRSVLTNPLLAGELSQKAACFAVENSWRKSAESHWNLYREVLNGSDLPIPSALVRYRAFSSRGYSSETAERLYGHLKHRLRGSVIEFGTRSVELTRWIEPLVSVINSTEFTSIAKLPGLDLPVLTTQEFKTSSFIETRFDTILLHVPNAMDACVSMVLAFLPHLSSDQRLLILVDERETHALTLTERFHSNIPARFDVDRVRLDSNYGLIDIHGSSLGEQQLEASKNGLQSSRQSTAQEPRSARVCWEGPQLVNHSLALVNREFELALLESGRVELTILPVGADTFADSLDEKARTLRSHYARELTGPADIHVRHQWPPNWCAPADGRWVLIQPWEYGSLPEEWVARVNRDVDEVWTYSTFVRELYMQSGVDPSRVQVVPNGVDAGFFRPGLKPYPLASNGSFKFLFVGGTIHRKGVDILLKAYRQAFAAADSVALVIKDMGTSNVYQGQGMGKSIVQEQSDTTCPEIIYLDQDMTDSEIARLYNACDCLVHPYRGEGFGLTVLEAMACALPVIVTAGGATDDFVDDTTGFRIPARKQVFGNRLIGDLKTVGDLWMLEPDVDALAETMLRVFNERENALNTGKRARAKVIEGWTWKHSATKSLERIEYLMKAPVFRYLRSYDAAVLIDLGDDSMTLEAGHVIESLKRNSYANLKIFLRVKHVAANLETLRAEHPDVQILSSLDFQASVGYIRAQVRAPFLALITEPLRFSKEWLKQLSQVAAQIGAGAKIVAPSTNLENSSHYVSQDADVDDHSFQRFARTVWRSHRGAYQELEEIPSGCVLLSWECLSIVAEDPVRDSRDCVTYLRKQGVRVYWARDTFVGQFPQPSLARR